MTGPRDSRLLVPPHESLLIDGMRLDGQHRRDDKPSPRWPIAAVALLGAIALIVGFFATRGAGDVEDQRDAAANQAQDLGSEVVAACARGDIVQSPDGRDLCAKAASVQAEPVPGVQLIEGPAGRPPTPEEIQRAVDAYLVAHPPPSGQPPSTEQVAAAVAEYMVAHPPEPGRPPTAQEIAAAVSTYFANNPPPAGPTGERGPRGRPGETGATGATGAAGEKGEPGRAPTDEEIRSAVNAWFAENGWGCPPDSTLQPVEFASGESGLGCVTGDAPNGGDEDDEDEDDDVPNTTPQTPTTAPTSAADVSPTGG